MAEGLWFGQRARVGVRGHQPWGLTVEIVGRKAIGSRSATKTSQDRIRGSPRSATIGCPARRDVRSRALDRCKSSGHKSDCARICARDSVGGVEMEETHHARPEHPPPVRRGQRGSQRLTGTPETGVVVLITQWSQVQILPPLPKCRSEASSGHGRGLLAVVCKRVCKRGGCGPCARSLRGLLTVAPDSRLVWSFWPPPWRTSW